MPKPKDYDTDMKPYWDYQRAKEYHKKFIWKLIPEEHQGMREELYNMVIKVGMIDDYEIPDDFHVGDELPVSQPPQDSWAWNCMNYRVSKVARPFILMTNAKWKNKGAI
tara:strand:+ start:512 stop:838 length:327 start_codon:yes stop_codon:yes gene_type:complete